MAAIYDEFAQAVQAGSINSEYTRNQMEFLTGRDDMSLAEARQWIDSYKGFYQVSDEDNLTKDVTSAWESLQAIYN